MGMAQNVLIFVRILVCWSQLLFNLTPQTDPTVTGFALCSSSFGMFLLERGLNVDYSLRYSKLSIISLQTSIFVIVTDINSNTLTN